MSPESFDYLLSKVGPIISKKTTRFRKPLPPEERLALTLRYLSSGDKQRSMSFGYRRGASTVSVVIRETCLTIWEALNEEYLRPPTLPEEWKNIAEEFENLWNIPHCIGAIDGKHIAMKCPNNSGSLYHNYKGFFSLVLMAVCDAHYVFTLVDIGDYGSNNDSGVLPNSPMAKALEQNGLGMPEKEPHNGFEDDLPYFLVGDDIFGLKTWLQRPFSSRGLSEHQRVFNYRLSRARRMIENAFGVLRARWQIFGQHIIASVETVETITKAAVCLHNFLRQTKCASYCFVGINYCGRSRIFLNIPTEGKLTVTDFVIESLINM